MGKNMIERCWICGSDKLLTGEHLVKKSDLKAEFYKQLLYIHTDKKRNEEVQGHNSDKLKSIARICERCNTNLTQPHDRAWESLSLCLRNKQRPMKNGGRIDLKKIFPGAVHRSMLNVHLYFVKLFGCKIVEGNIPINIQPFSFAILNDQPHDKVYLAICSKLTGYVGHSEICTDSDDRGKIVFASWYYELPSFCVRIMFAEQSQYRNGLINAWHPSKIDRFIKIARAI